KRKDVRRPYPRIYSLISRDSIQQCRPAVSLYKYHIQIQSKPFPVAWRKLCGDGRTASFAYNIDRTATKTAAHHARAHHIVQGFDFVHQEIQLGTTHFVT